jgi:hypothetical protein
MSLDAMRLALKALELLARYENPATKIQVRKPRDGGSIVTMYPHKVASEAATALRAAIEQAQEPIAWVGPSWMNPETRTWESESFAPRPINGWSPLYTTPRQWQGLTDEEIKAVIQSIDRDEQYLPNALRQFARAIEAKLREKNT